MSGEHDHNELYATLDQFYFLQDEFAKHDHDTRYASIESVQAIMAQLDDMRSHTHEPQTDGAVIVAASDWPWKDGAHFVCDGIDDELEINAAHDLLPSYGGKIVLTGGHFVPNNPIRITKDQVSIEGFFGASTTICPPASFPEDFVLSFYRDDRSPLARASLSNLWIRGNGIAYTHPVHGLEWVSYRGHVHDVWISQLSGTGMAVHNVPATGDGWNCYESTFADLNIGGCNVGMDVNSTDQHWSRVQSFANVLANVDGSFTGTMLDSCHFYGGTQNPAKTQTVNNVILHSCSRMSITNSKIEHAARELLRLEKSGWARIENTGFRNGCSEPGFVGPQMLIGGVPDAWWNLILLGCRFDKDAESSKPTRNIQIQGETMHRSRIESCMFSGASIEAITPFGPWADDPRKFVGRGSVINGQGVTTEDPNVGGDWKGYGQMGLRVRELGTTKIWHAQSENEWI